MNAATYLLEASNKEAASIAMAVYDTVCRDDFTAPGFALLRLPKVSDSLTLRRQMVELKEALSDLHLARSGLMLGWYTMSRFDQKFSTKLHRDGGPMESLLILGYEPTEVDSVVSIADYSACAHQMGITPETLLAEHNPMYEMTPGKLQEFTRELGAFDRNQFQILVINNSSCPFDAENRSWQGVLHGARIVSYEEGQSRVINSTSVVPRAPGEKEQVEPNRIEVFLTEEKPDFDNYR